MKSLLITTFILISSISYGFQMSLDLVDANGQIQTVNIEAEKVDLNEFSPGMYMPYVVFPNGDYALIDSKSDLDEVICEKLKGKPVPNPYRDLRMSFSQKLSYRRGIFSGTYSVRGNKNIGYYEEEMMDSDLSIVTLGCSTY